MPICAEMKTAVRMTFVLLLCALSLSAAPNPFEFEVAPRPENKIDELVFARLSKLGIEPANVCSDGVFVRRVYLDVIGTLPTTQEAQKFILDKTPNKRQILVDRLLERDEFAEYWAMKWSDLLRVKAEFPINLWPNAAQEYHHWIRDSIRDNKPYDQFARELLTASGSNFRVGPVNFYRAMQNRQPSGIAQTVALTFMGTRAEKWPTNQLAGMAGFFAKVGYKYTAEWKEEIVYFDPAKTNATALPTIFPDGKPAKILPDQDPREVFADWLITPHNPWFTRAIANRAWSWLMGRGIVEEPDDICAENPPSNPELLAYLERQLISDDYDLKKLFRLILNSQAYQLSCVAKSDKPEAAANFASYLIRRLDAEVLIDALNQITGGAEKYSSAIPEPYTFIPEDVRSIELPDGSITSSFLEMFGKPPRDTGLERERNNRISADQELHMLNSSHVQRKLEQSKLVQLQMQPNITPQQTVNGSYLAILSRFPTQKESAAAEEYFKRPGLAKRDAVIDLVWALVNSPEFLYRH